MANFGKEEGSWSAVKPPGHNKSHHMMLTHMGSRTCILSCNRFQTAPPAECHQEAIWEKWPFWNQSEKNWHFAGGQMDNQAEFLPYESISLHVLQYLGFFYSEFKWHTVCKLSCSQGWKNKYYPKMTSLWKHPYFIYIKANQTWRDSYIACIAMAHSSSSVIGWTLCLSISGAG